MALSDWTGKKSSGGGFRNKWTGTASTSDENPTTDPGIMVDDAEAAYSEKLATNKKAVAMALQRLYQAGDVEGYKKVLNDTGKVFTPEDMKTYGLDRIVIKKEGGNFLGGAKEKLGAAQRTIGNTAVGGALGKAIEKLDAPRVVGTAALRQGLWGFGNAAEILSGGRLQGGVEGGWNKFREDLGRGSEFDLGDIFNEADVNLQEKGATHVVGDSARGKLQKGANVGGYVVLDPLSYVGGSSAAQKQLMGRITAEVGETTAKKIAVHGLEKGVAKGIISEAEHEAVRAVARRQAEELAQIAAEGGMKKGLLPATIKRQTYKMAKAGDTEALAARSMRTIENEGRAGLKVGVGQNKKTLIPSYIDGHSVLNPRQYTADIMKGVGAVPPQGASAVDDAIKAVEAAPSATGAGGYGKVVEGQLPSTPGVHVVDDGAGGKIIGIRNADGVLEGYMMTTDDAVNTFESLTPTKGTGQKLLQAAEDAGLDVPAMLANSDFTESGRKSALRWLKAKGGAAAAEGAETVDTALARGERTGLSALPQNVAQPGMFDEAVQETPEWLNKRAGVDRRNPLDVLRQSRLGQAVGSGLSPRAGVRADVGARGAETLYGAQETAGAAISQRTHDLWLQLGKTSDKGIEALKDGAGLALESALPSLKGLKGREAFNEMMTAVAEQRLSPETIRAVEEAVHGEAGAITRAADAIAQAAFEGGIHAAPEEALRAGLDVKPTVAKIISPAGEEALRGEAGLKLREALGLKSDTVLKAGDDLTKEAIKVMRSERGIKALNDALAERVGLAPGTKLFHEDVVASIALRSRATFEAATMTDMYQGLANVMIDHNTPLITIAQKGDAAAAKAAADNKWVKFMGKQPTVGDIYGPESVMKELAKIQDIVINDEALAGFRKFLDGWNGTWASYAINPLPFGTGFHARNATGNVLLSFLGGLTNPAKYAEAAGVQKDLYKVRRQMTKNGLGFEQAMQAAEISDYSKYVINNGRKHGIISAGFFADLDNYDLDRLLSSGSPSVGQRAKHFIQDNKLLRANRKVGDVIENNARLALFMDGLDKTNDVVFAANNVKKYLFDYQDLTPFERRNMKSFNRFYTFMRKNTGVQLYALAHDPWKQKMILQAEGSTYRDDPNAPMPDYAEKGGFNVSRILGTPKGTQGIGMNIETPLDSAMKTLDPIFQAATMVPGFNKVVPPEYRSDKQKLATAVLNSRSGGPQEFVNFLFESATGKDTFSGKDISEETGAEARMRLANAFMPLFGKAERGLGGTVVGQREPGMDTRLTVMKALTGINVLPLTDKQRNQIAYVQSQELQDALDKLKDEGVDVPTYTELVRLGLAPDLSKLNKPNEKKKARTSEQVTEDTATKLNAARAALGMPEVPESGLNPKKAKSKTSGLSKWTS